MATILVTGGAGFIGSHTVLGLLGAGHTVVVLDSFVNSSLHSLVRVAQLAGPSAAIRLSVVEGDIRVASDLQRAFSSVPSGAVVDAVIHLAGLKAVDDSCRNPVHYWDVNVRGSLQLLAAMRAYSCRTILFSSTAALYGVPSQVPTPETSPIKPVSVYGYSKAAVERLLVGLAENEHSWRLASLRYFNAVGAHPSGIIGEASLKTSGNLFPSLSQVASGRRDKLVVFGDDWPTGDGSCIRDYIHVMDLADAQIAVMEWLMSGGSQFAAVNLGTGLGNSVFQVRDAYEAVSRRSLPYEVHPRRLGDVAKSIADPSLAAQRFGWHAKRTLAECCRDSWSWQIANPYGFAS